MEASTLVVDGEFRRVWLRPLHTVNIVGLMGTGKTTLARYLYSVFKWGRNEKYRAVSVYFQYDKNKIEDFFEALESIEAYAAYVVLDDLSFAATHLDRATRELLHGVAKVRHRNRRVRRWVIVTIVHYSKAALPFLRLAATKILTSLTSTEEIEALREAFPVQTLWDYYHLYTREPTRHWILVNWLGQIGISRFRRPRRRCWDIVVNGPRCV